MLRDTAFVLCFILAALGALLPGCAEKPPAYNDNPSFSARLVIDYKDALQEYKLNFSGDKIRLEMLKPGTGVSIIRKDLGVVWTLMTENRLFLELPVRPENKNPLIFKPDKVLSYKKLGEEDAGGRTLLKEEMTIQNEGDNKKEFYRWFDTGLGWPVRAEALKGSWKLRLSDIEPGPQDPALFEIPAGYNMINARKRPVPKGGPH